jgi:signal transduction histidine kinase
MDSKFEAASRAEALPRPPGEADGFIARLLRAYARLAGGDQSGSDNPYASDAAQARYALALRAAVYRSLPFIAMGSAAFYGTLVLIAVQHPAIGGDVLAFSLLSAAVTIGVRIAWGFDVIAQRWAHSVVGAMTALLIIHTLYRWALSGGGQEGGLVGMSLLIAGSLCLSLPWAIGLTVGGLIVWFSITIAYLHQWPDLYLSAFLVACPSVAAVVRLARRATIERMDEYRRRDLHQRGELRRAHRKLEAKVRERTANLLEANEQLRREIAERQRIEAELEQARLGLERRVQERTAELSDVNAALRREIAERERAEKQMQQHRAELAHTLRVQTVGQMMGSLAHELNQPLSAIANNMEACSTYLESPNVDCHTLRELVNNATAEALRAGSIVHHLRAFIEKREPHSERCDLGDLAEEVLDLLDPEIRDHAIQMELVNGESSLPIFANRIQIEQVIVNLVRNAIDAMSSLNAGGRRLRIELLATPHGSAELSVVDNGCGLNQKHAQRLFEPFFTTKRSGLGLGLAISRSIMEAHHGRLWLEGRPDGQPGTVAKFELPIRKGGGT